MATEQLQLFELLMLGFHSENHTRSTEGQDPGTRDLARVPLPEFVLRPRQLLAL